VNIMGKVLNVRLDDETHSRITRIARARRRSRSEIVREMIMEGARRAESADTAYDHWRQVIGIAEGLPADLSERTGDKVRRLLEDRATEPRR
jgi:predicted transcriptional regulator